MITTLYFFASFVNASVLGPGDGLGQLEKAVVFDLAEILRSVHFLRADDLRAVLGRPLDQADLVREVFPRVGGAGHLREADVYRLCGAIAWFSFHVSVERYSRGGDCLSI